MDKSCAEKLRRVLRLKFELVPLLGLIFFSIMTVINFVKYVRTRKRIMPTLAGLVMVFVTVVIYFRINILIIPALLIFFLVSIYAIADKFAGKTLTEEIAEKLKRIEKKPRWYDFLMWKPLLILRDKFGDTLATVTYSVLISALTVVGYVTLSKLSELQVSIVVAGILAIIAFVTCSLNIYCALKRLEI